MTPDERALRDAWLAECWKPCPEVPREQRARDRLVAGLYAEALGTLCERPVDDQRDAS